MTNSREARVEAQLRLVQSYVETAGFDDEQMALETGISELQFGASDFSRRAIERVFKDHYRGSGESSLEQQAIEGLAA